MALRKPRSNVRLPTKGSQQGLVDREENGGGVVKSKKRKLSESLGPPWSKSDLEIFYQAYRKHGKDWKKVAGSMQKRSKEMVEAVYRINQAYLSLPEGAASAAGLIAMMTDRFNIVDESEEESSEEFGTSDRSNQTQSQLQPMSAYENSNSGPLGYGGPSPAKKPRSVVTGGRHWGKRTPRFHSEIVTDQKMKNAVLNKVVQDVAFDPENELGDEFKDAKLVMALTVVSPAPVSKTAPLSKATPTRRYRGAILQNGHAKESSFKADPSGSGPKRPFTANGEGLDGHYERKERIGRGSSTATVEAELVNGARGQASDDKNRWKKSPAKKLKLQNPLDKVDEQTSQPAIQAEDTVDDTEDKGILGHRKNRLSSQRSKGRNRQLFRKDESAALAALAQIASIECPSPTHECPSPTSLSVSEEEEINPNRSGSNFKLLKESAEKTSKDDVKRDGLRNGYDDEKLKDTAVKDGVDTGVANGLRQMSISPPDSRKRKRKPALEKVGIQEKSGPYNQAQTNVELQALPQKVENPVVLKPVRKLKGTTIAKPVSKQGAPKTSNAGNAPALNLELSVREAVQCATVEKGNLPLKLRSKKKGMPGKGRVNGFGAGSPSALGAENARGTPHCPHTTSELGPFNVTARLNHCLSSHQVRRWCVYEWFYSALELPWFARNEFVEYLIHAGLGHVRTLTRTEWGVIRSSLGKPRRLSKSFLRDERRKLEGYREAVRRTYQDLRSGRVQGLSSDLARPLTVGQRVTAIHPTSKELHNGSILTVDHSKCRVQFDCPDLGVEFVMDINIMPVHPLDNMPELMRRQQIIVDGVDRMLEDPKQSQTAISAGGAARAALNESMERHGSIPSVSALSQLFLTNLIKTSQANSVDSVHHAKVAANEAVAAAQQALRSQHLTFGQPRVRESDIRTLADLGGALSNKEILVGELQRMNDEPTSLKSNEGFQMQYGIVTKRLKEVNGQVSDALRLLRAQSRYQDALVQPWHRIASQLVGGPSLSEGSFAGSLEASADSADITATSKKHARAMVSVAVQSLAALQEGEDPLAKIGGALDCISRGAPTMKGRMTVGAPSSPEALVPMNNTATTTGATSVQAIVHNYIEPAQSADSDKRAPLKSVAYDSEDAAATEPSNGAAFGERAQLPAPTELMASCVASLLMVQTLTEQQFSSQVVALTLDNALETLRPQAAQNHCIFKDIKYQIECIKSQIMSKLPIQSVETAITPPRPTQL